MYGDGGAPCGDITRLLREIMFRNMRRLRIRFISGSLPFLLSSLMMMPEAERKKTKLSITETKMSVVGDPGKSIDNGHSEGGYAKVISESLKTSLMTSSDSVLMNYKWTRKQNNTCPKR